MKLFFSFLALALVLTFSFFAGNAYAQEKKAEMQHMTGTVESVDMEKHMFTITGHDGMKTVIHVGKDTEFDIEKGKGKHGYHEGKFADLKSGEWVKVRSHMDAKKEHMAKEVRIYE